jgi:hypothetical protein
MRKLALLAIAAVVGANVFVSLQPTKANPALAGVVATSPYDVDPDANVRFPVMTIADLF